MQKAQKSFSIYQFSSFSNNWKRRAIVFLWILIAFLSFAEAQKKNSFIGVGITYMPNLVMASNGNEDYLSYFSPNVSYMRINAKKQILQVGISDFVFLSKKNVSPIHYGSGFYANVKQQMIVGLQASFTHFILKKHKLQPGIGLGDRIYWTSETEKHVPQMGNLPSSSKRFGTNLVLLPTFKLQVSSKIAFLLSLPIPFCDFSYQQYELDNPSLPLNLRKNSFFNFDLYKKKSFINASLTASFAL